MEFDGSWSVGRSVLVWGRHANANAPDASGNSGDWAQDRRRESIPNKVYGYLPVRGMNSSLRPAADSGMRT